MQLELKSNNKTKILYLNPLHIDLDNLYAKHLSHKPPQSLYTSLGSDPHERVSSGQPFSSTHYSNFSSKHIPIFSSVVENFRNHHKRGKSFSHQGDYKNATISFFKALDPGVDGVANASKKTTNTIKEMILTSKKSNRSDNNNKKKDKIIGIQKLVNTENKNNEKLLLESSSYFSKNNTIIDGIKAILESLKIKDSITLQNIMSIGLFFGFGPGGTPLVSGWFAGIIANLMKSHAVTLTKEEDHTIKFDFNRKSAETLTVLVGTGQGLENNHKLITAHGIDYGTLLPIEANIILALNSDSKNNFSFTIVNNKVDEFLTTFFTPDNNKELDEELIKNTTFNCQKDKDITFMIETKSELRAQIGFMANPTTYLVLPRAALGLRFATKIFHINHQKETTIDVGENPSIKKDASINVGLISVNGGIFHERKIMPITMMTGYQGTDNVLCFPLPLIEETNHKLPNTRNKILRKYRIDDAKPSWDTNDFFNKKKILTQTTSSTTLNKIEKNLEVTNVPSGLNLQTANQLSLALYTISNKFTDILSIEIRNIINHVGSSIQKSLFYSSDYQSIKAAENISMFNMSVGDYKKNISSLDGGENSDICDNHIRKIKPQRFKKIFSPWKKNIKIGEFFFHKENHIKVAKRKNDYSTHTASDFLKSVENYAARYNRDSNGKSTKVVAIATYKLQPEIIKSIAEKFIDILEKILFTLEKGNFQKISFREEIYQLKEIEKIFHADNDKGKSFYRLHDISLIKQGAITHQLATIPTVILNLMDKNELILSESLGSIHFNYLAQDMLPHKISSSLKIMPELIYEKDKFL